MRVWTIGHGTRPASDLLEMLERAGVQTLVDVRRYPGSRRNPQYNRGALAAVLAGSGIAYRHVEALGGLLSGEPGEDRFACIRQPAFRSYAARMGTPEWQAALADAIAEPNPCFMCAETPWAKCHRRFIADLLTARGHEVLHLSPEGVEPHRLPDESGIRDGRLYLCGELVA
jgi:uncharacterized protein (DUF488 family)